MLFYMGWGRSRAKRDLQGTGGDSGGNKASILNNANWAWWDGIFQNST